MQYVARNQVAKCCIEILRAFGVAFKPKMERAGNPNTLDLLCKKLKALIAFEVDLITQYL